MIIILPIHSLEYVAGIIVVICVLFWLFADLRKSPKISKEQLLSKCKQAHFNINYSIEHSTTATELRMLEEHVDRFFNTYYSLGKITRDYSGELYASIQNKRTVIRK